MHAIGTRCQNPLETLKFWVIEHELFKHFLELNTSTRKCSLQLSYYVIQLVLSVDTIMC